MHDTGGVASFGVGGTHTKCSKQKINRKNSTEFESIGASDCITYFVCLSGFMRGQGCKVNKKGLYHGNTSAMQIEKIGSFSSSEKSRHLNIRFFTT